MAMVASWVTRICFYYSNRKTCAGLTENRSAPAELAEKSECRNPKLETNPKHKIQTLQTPPATGFGLFAIWRLGFVSHAELAWRARRGWTVCGGCRNSVPYDGRVWQDFVASVPSASGTATC